MTRQKMVAGAAVALLATAGAGATLAGGKSNGNKTDAVRAALDGAKPRNVILLLGDGMGTQEITTARYVAYGANGRMNIDRLPFTGLDKTWSLTPGAGPRFVPDYVPDSASAGTEWATGKKTIDERVSQGPSSAFDVPGSNTGYDTVLELAQRAGKKVGNVSTAEITDATPAVLASHMSLRGCQGPTDTKKSCAKETKAAGGLGSIAEQEVDHKQDVVLGGGRARFEQPTDAGPTVVDSAKAQGYEYVTDAAGLAGAQAGKPVLGLFTAGNMSLEWTGPPATFGPGTPAAACQTGRRPANEPSLADMTTKAIALLDNPKGFFLQVEGASIDKQDHATNACAQIGETVAFDDAVGAALAYQAKNPDTLIVATADHTHTSEIVPEDIGTTSSAPTGYSTNVIARDGQALRLTYGTSGYGGPGKPPVAAPPSQQHTGSVVPVFAGGPQAANVLGTNDHTDLFRTLRGRAAQRNPAGATKPAARSKLRLVPKRYPTTHSG